jgi:hypothetical protein
VGEIIDKNELINRYDQFTGPYAAKLKENSYIDCACDRGVGSTANSKPGSNNASFSVSFRNNVGSLKVKATKNIKNNSEVFLSYGSGYTYNDRAQHKTINVRK